MKCVNTARRVYIPLTATVAVLQTMRKPNGQLYTNPKDILLNSLAVIFVLKLDEALYPLVVSPEMQGTIVKAFERSMQNTKSAPACKKSIHFRAPFEIYLCDLNLLNRVTAIFCIAFFFVGYLGGDENSYITAEFQWLYVLGRSCDERDDSLPCIRAYKTSISDPKVTIDDNPEGFCREYWGSSWSAEITSTVILFGIYIIFILFSQWETRLRMKLSYIFTTISGFNIGLCAVYAATLLGYKDVDWTYLLLILSFILMGGVGNLCTDYSANC